MRDFLYRLVARLHEPGRPLSRNRHFHVFTGGARRALRIDRHLRDLELQLAAMRDRGQRPLVREQAGGGATLALTDPRLSVVRTASLTREEVALLRAHPAGAWAFGDGGGPQQAAGAPARAGSEG